MKFDQFSDSNIDESIGLREITEKYLKHLKWFLLSILIFGSYAYWNILTEIPKYNVNARILIKDSEKKSSTLNDLSMFDDLGLFGASNSNLINEIETIKSRRLVSKVVEELKLNIRYFIEDSPYDKEYFPNFPIILKFKSDSSTISNIGTKFTILIKSNNDFEILNFENRFVKNGTFGEDFKIDLGNEERSDKRIINIDLNENFPIDIIGKKIVVLISPLKSMIKNYLGKISIEPLDELRSNILTLSINESRIMKGIAFINNLIDQYNADGINDKNLISQTTTDFLDIRLGIISTELGAIESTAEIFKTRNRMINQNSGSEIFLQSSSKNENEIIATNTQLLLLTYMLEDLEQKSKGELLPGNIGLSDLSVGNLSREYNELTLKRNRILKSSSEINPIIIGIDSELEGLKSSLIISLNNSINSTKIKIESLSKQSGTINSRIASVPKNEREFNNIVRQQETKNALYLFLLQKREESILSNSVNVEKSKIIDEAFSDGSKVSPKKVITYMKAIFFGLLIPFLIIYAKDILDVKVHDEKDLSKLRIPYIGDIPLKKSNKYLFIEDGDNSNVAEAFRYIRTNINFMLESKSMGKIVFVTSTQSKEGKTFTAINLASSLAISGKKTLLLGMDLRAPRITKYLDLKKVKGITNYIKDVDLTIDNITVNYSKIKNLDVVNAGNIPPNPVELLMNNRVKVLFEAAKEKYEYVIVDTAPVGLVTDTIQIGKYPDLTIYVIRANVLDKRKLHIPEKLHKENRLLNMAILINGSDHSKGAYGYGYNYGYGDNKKKPWYKRTFS